MKRPFPLLFTVLLLAIVFMPSCRNVKDLEFRDYKNMRLDGLGFSSSRLLVDLIYYNPNNFGLQLNNTDLDIFVNDNFLGHSSQNLQVAIPARKEFTLPMAVDLDMKNLLKNGLTALSNKEVNVRLVGKIKLGKGGFYKSFPVDYTTKQVFSF